MFRHDALPAKTRLTIEDRNKLLFLRVVFACYFQTQLVSLPL